MGCCASFSGCGDVLFAFVDGNHAYMTHFADRMLEFESSCARFEKFRDRQAFTSRRMRWLTDGGTSAIDMSHESARVSEPMLQTWRSSNIIDSCDGADRQFDSPTSCRGKALVGASFLFSALD